MDKSLAEEVQQTIGNTCAQSLFLYVAVPQFYDVRMFRPSSMNRL